MRRQVVADARLSLDMLSLIHHPVDAANIGDVVDCGHLDTRLCRCHRTLTWGCTGRRDAVVDSSIYNPNQCPEHASRSELGE